MEGTPVLGGFAPGEKEGQEKERADGREKVQLKASPPLPVSANLARTILTDKIRPL